MNANAYHVALREPETVMRLKRLGSLHQCRLSFMRILTRRMAHERWKFSRHCFEIDERGVGHAVYCAHAPERTYSLVAFAHDLPDELRSDRVIAEAWDATFTLFDGIPEKADIKRLSENVPKQEAGRISRRELSLSRANRSVRLWSHVIEALASGRQPDPEPLEEVGYLMRTTAVYGSGKFGASDRASVAKRPEMRAPFQVEMLSVYLIRTFVRDLVEHMAHVKGGKQAVALAKPMARRLGIGNSTGLGMAPFLINHPVLLNNWIKAREEAVARVRSLKTAEEEKKAVFFDLFERSMILVEGWRSSHPLQLEKLAYLKNDIGLIKFQLQKGAVEEDFPWNKLIIWSQVSLSEEGQEFLASLILEPYGELIDGLADTMADNNADAFMIDGSMSVGEALQLIGNCFEWAFSLNWEEPEHCARVWYVSEEKLEPRLGQRFEEPVEAYEQPLVPARDAAKAHKDLLRWSHDTTLAEFLLAHPEHRHTIRRAQMARIAPYGEIRDNTIGACVLPVDMLRAKLSFFGATRFDPRSDRWIRICMYAGAPYPEELNRQNADYWVYPEKPPCPSP